MFGLKRQLTRQGQNGASPAFQEALWTKLSGAYDAKRPMTAPARFAWPRAYAIGAAAFVLFFSMGTGVYAYESPDVYAGHPLYSIKEGVENVEGRLAMTPEQLKRYQAKMAERHAAEADRLAMHPERMRRFVAFSAAKLDMTPEEFVEGLRNPETRDAIMSELVDRYPRLAQVASRVLSALTQD